jgi:hypothetical protein
MTSPVTAQEVSRRPRQLMLWRADEEPFYITAEAQQQLIQLLAELLFAAARRANSLEALQGDTAT